MIAYVLRRLLTMAVTLFVISVLVFIIIKLPPGDFLTNQIDELQSQGGQASAAKAVDGLAVGDFGVLAFGDERSRARLDAECPIGTAGAGHLRELVNGARRAFGHPHPRGRLDEFG